MADTGNTSRADAAADGFTAEERAAMKERAAELRSAGRAKRGAKTDDEAVVRAKIAEMPEPDRSLAERIHAIVTEAAPELTSRTWYGMPAYAKDGKIVCFFQPASKFTARYATLGFDQKANLDEGEMWPTAWAITELTPETEARIADLVRRAVS